MLKKAEKKYHSDRMKEIEQIFKKIELQMDSSGSADSSFDIDKMHDNNPAGGDEAYRDTIYKALGMAFSNIFDNTREIERTNRIIASFHDGNNGGNRVSRILSNIEDKRNREIISKREKEILLTLPWEKTNKEISLELDISEKTVKNHLCRIYRKLRVKNRIQLFRHLNSA
ncbi:MAG: helix-turn-helix transcriptional regulator [Candidatus Krumholzibacteriota bacterium]|nr:helix-turn-helix transcriptional regulator [Candidatus Krumholzibacteriota bacterium]